MIEVLTMDYELAINGGKPVRSKPLPANYPGAIIMGEEEANAASKVIHSQSPFRFYGEDMQYAAEDLEERMAKDLGVPYVLGVTSCTAALVTALKALGIGYGDKVIVPAVTFIATAGAVVSANAVPVFVDVDESMNLDVLDLERVFDDEVKAIIAVPLLGAPCQMDKIMAFANKHGIYVIEDVAQSCGVRFKGEQQGTIGDIGVFSFQMNKMLTAGEGGAIATRNLEWFERAVRYHDQGSFRKRLQHKYGIETQPENAFAGQNYRMSEITAAVLVEQWKKLDLILKPMKDNYLKITDALSRQLPGLKLRPTCDREGDLGSMIGMTFENIEQADQFSKALTAENIACGKIYNAMPVYKFPQIFNQRSAERDGFPYNYPFKKEVVYSDQMCPKAEDLLTRMVFVSVSALLSAQDCEEMIQGIVKVYEGLNFYDVSK
jgi:8-amino-3,8-dideoxy-alpha-D-manno-octulosonate transaminase